MNDEAVVSSLQAQNYTATLALYAITKTPIYKSFPLAFRDLWYRLEAQTKAIKDLEMVKEVQSYSQLYEERCRIIEDSSPTVRFYP